MPVAALPGSRNKAIDIGTGIGASTVCGEGKLALHQCEQYIFFISFFKD